MNNKTTIKFRNDNFDMRVLGRQTSSGDQRKLQRVPIIQAHNDYNVHHLVYDNSFIYR